MQTNLVLLYLYFIEGTFGGFRMVLHCLTSLFVMKRKGFDISCPSDFLRSFSLWNGVVAVDK